MISTKRECRRASLNVYVRLLIDCWPGDRNAPTEG
jgi:hypothetical protein